MLADLTGTPVLVDHGVEEDASSAAHTALPMVSSISSPSRSPVLRFLTTILNRSEPSESVL
jgi:hypothetical protein